MKRFLTTASSVLLIIFTVGCTKATGIYKAAESSSGFDDAVYEGETIEVNTNPENKVEYRIFHQGATGFTPISAVRASAEQRADEFCADRDGTRVTIREQYSVPPHILGNWPRIEIIFICNPPTVESNVDILSALERLADLRDRGAITNEEFEREKAKLLEN